MFTFWMPADSARMLANDLEAYPVRGPVHERIIAQLRPDTGDDVVCQVESRDEPVLAWWADMHPGAPWQPALTTALAMRAWPRPRRQEGALGRARHTPRPARTNAHAVFATDGFAFLPPGFL
ncbi:MAG: hypothetical protein ACYDBQ_09715 [Thermoplasmatota archaeon]